MARINPKELHSKSKKDLRDLLAKERQHLRDLYFRLSGAQLKNIHEINQTKRNIATILTVLKEQDTNHESR